MAAGKYLAVIVIGVAALLAPARAQQPSPAPTPTSTPTPTPKPLFIVPRTWTKVTHGAKQLGITDLGNYVFAHGGFTQGFGVLEAPSGGLDLSSYEKLNLQDLARAQKSFRVISDDAVSLCDGQQGRFLRYHSQLNGRALTFGQIFAVSGTKAYVATYSRAASQKDDPQALAALRSLCPVKAPAVAADMSPVPFAPPAGWQRLNPAAFPEHVDGLIAYWMHPNGAAVPDSLNLMEAESHIGSLDIASQGTAIAKAIQQKYPSAALRGSHVEPVCDGAYKGWYLEYGLTIRAKDFIIEQSVAAAENVQYVATYARPASEPEDPAARRALDTLCPAGAQASS